jgi:hypothetical protein
MSLENRVFKTLFKESKTELSAYKIELSLVDDFKTIGKNILKNSDKAFLESEQSSKKIGSFVDEAISLIDKSVSIYSKIEKQSKEIGFKIPSNLSQINNDNQSELKALIKLRQAVATLRSVN